MSKPNQIKELAEDHWEYTRRILTVLIKKDTKFEVQYIDLIEMLQTVYILSAMHFYKHGYNDGRQTK